MFVIYETRAAFSVSLNLPCLSSTQSALLAGVSLQTRTRAASLFIALPHTRISFLVCSFSLSDAYVRLFSFSLTF